MSARTAKPSPLEANLHTLDALYQEAGLSRNRHQGRSWMKRVRAKRTDKEDLFYPAEGVVEASNGVGLLEIPAWRKLDWLWHGFSTRLGGVSRTYCAEGAPGDLNLSFTEHDTRKNVETNRKRLAEAVSGDAATPIIAVRQFHSDLISEAEAGRRTPAKADGILTREPGILLAIQTADCVPVLVADRKRKIVAAFHAGWRGTVQRIVERGVGRMRLEFGSRPEDLIAAIGPSVGPCCYAVGDEVQAEFESQFPYAAELFHEVEDADAVRQKYPMLFLTQRAPGHSPIGPSLHLDLQEANRRQLLAAGLKPRSIAMTRGCTQCQCELFFSHRGAQGRTGRMMSLIGIKKL